jgi:hypothetical protein
MLSRQCIERLRHREVILIRSLPRGRLWICKGGLSPEPRMLFTQFSIPKLSDPGSLMFRLFGTSLKVFAKFRPTLEQIIQALAVFTLNRICIPKITEIFLTSRCVAAKRRSMQTHVRLRSNLKALLSMKDATARDYNNKRIIKPFGILVFKNDHTLRLAYLVRSPCCQSW